MLLIKEKSIYWQELSLSNNLGNTVSRNALRDTECTWKMEVHTHLELWIWSSLRIPWINHWPTRGSSHPIETWTSYGWMIYGMPLLFICLIQVLARLWKELVVQVPRNRDNQSCNLTFYKMSFCSSTRIWPCKYTKTLQNNYQNYKY